MRATTLVPSAFAMALLSIAASTAQAASPVGSEFTYQGRLTSTGATVTGTCSFRFRLFDAASAGSQIGSTLIYDGQSGNPAPIAVTGGLFTVGLDFGAGAFTSDARWLDIDVKCGADAGYTNMGRQKITATPYSLSTPALQGRPISSAAPTAGQVLLWNGTAWVPTTPAFASDTGCPGPRIRGVCVLSWDSRQQTNFLGAAISCGSAGGDICTDSQAWPLAVGNSQNVYQTETPLWNAHWTASFADNDSQYWTGANGGTGDDHSPNSSYGYACCGGTTPANPRVPVQTINNVRVTYVHNVSDTYFSGAAGTCAALNSDLCSDSQTLLLRDAAALTVPSWTNAHSDNDGNLYSAINGGTSDDPQPASIYGFACCASLLPADLSCPVTRFANTVCAPVIHNSADTDFRAAATACASQGYDLCSIAQEAVLRQFGQLSVPAWSNSHSDNDSGNASVGVGAMPDNPPLTLAAGYACCVK